MLETRKNAEKPNKTQKIPSHKTLSLALETLT